MAILACDECDYTEIGGADKIGKRCIVRTESSAICHGVLRMRGGQPSAPNPASPKLSHLFESDVLAGVLEMRRGAGLQAVLTFRDEDARAEFAQAVLDRGARLSA